MNESSYFIKDRAMFGSYPKQTSVYELEKKGVTVFVDLTYEYEKKITPYITHCKYIRFPIQDRHIPQDWIKYAKFIMYISNIIKSLKDTEKMYIHCKGGHGRSGVVVASVLCYMNNLKPDESIIKTTKYHNNRINMKDKWRTIGSPQTYQQKHFIHKFFSDLTFFKACSSGNTIGFSNFTKHNVPIIGLGIFHSSESAYQALKDQTNIDYVQKHLNVYKPLYSKIIGDKHESPDDWGDRQYDTLFVVLKSKFDTHDELKYNLINTGLRPIIYHTKRDNILGDGGDGNGMNILGKSLSRLREHYYNCVSE